MTRSYRVLPLLIMTLLGACRKDKPEPPDDRPLTAGQGGVYVVNEGNFQWGNASVSYYDIATGNSTEDLYAPANGNGLGDVLQSMALHNGRAYLVVNNSGKVVVVDPDDFVASATITGLVSPRYLVPVDDTKAYVTDMMANNIHILDLSSNSITGSIPCPGWTEQLVLAYGKAFVTNQARRYVYVVDTATDQLVDSIQVSKGGNSIVVDAQDKLWVACTGGSGTVLPGVPFVAANDRNFYGLGVDPNSGEVYVADAIDYAQRGMVFRYGADGTALNGFLAGRIPGGFVFR